MTIPLINLGKILVWKNDNSIDQPRFNIQGRVGARRLVGANLWLAQSAKNNLIDGLFLFSQLQNCANTFSSISIFNVIHLHTELHTYDKIKIYLEPILGLKYWKMWQLILSCRLNMIWWREALINFWQEFQNSGEKSSDKGLARSAKIFWTYSTRKISDPPSRGYEKFLTPPSEGSKNFFDPPLICRPPPTRN